jgi:hypothetical protein
MHPISGQTFSLWGARSSLQLIKQTLHLPGNRAHLGSAFHNRHLKHRLEAASEENHNHK